MKKQFLTIAAAATLTITASLAFAASVELPVKPTSATDYTASNADTYTKVVRLTELDTEQTYDSVDYQTMYPYVLMSYFAEKYKLGSEKAAKQAALQQRMDLLEKAGFSAITDPAFIPEGVKSLFVAENAPKKIRQQSGLIGGLYHANSQFKARLFLNPEQKKVVIAIAGTNFSSLTSMLSAYSLGTGEVSQAAFIARIVATDMQTMYPDFTIELTGASQGGAIAQYAAVEPRIKGRAIVFNSQGIHPSITSKWSGSQKKRISHAYLDGELLNGEQVSGYRYSFGSYAARSAIQNTMPVEGVAVSIDPILESYINDAYYKSSRTAGKANYYLTPKSAILHWTGALLEAFEYHADYVHLPSLY